MLSCLFWESLGLVSWYLETARNSEFHCRSNRKGENLNAFQTLVSQIRTAWLQSGPRPPYHTHSQKHRMKRKSNTINALSYKLQLPWRMLDNQTPSTSGGAKKHPRAQGRSGTWESQQGQCTAWISIRVVSPVLLRGLDASLSKVSISNAIDLLMKSNKKSSKKEKKKTKEEKEMWLQCTEVDTY